jgi:hypothetical protein
MQVVELQTARTRRHIKTKRRFIMVSEQAIPQSKTKGAMVIKSGFTY